MTALSAAFVPAARLPTGARRGLLSRPSVTPRPSAARPARWRLMASPDPNKPGTPPSSSSPPSPPSIADYGVELDTEAIVERAKAVATDLTDRPAYYSKIAGYAAGGIVTITVLRAIVSAIDSLPILPAALELIGLGYAAWFVWRYVLFRESRAELLEEIDDFLGRTRPGSD